MRCPNKSSRNAREPPRAHRLDTDAVRLILVGFAYFVLAYLGVWFAPVNPSATPIWAPTGLAIARFVVGPTCARHFCCRL